MVTSFISELVDPAIVVEEGAPELPLAEISQYEAEEAVIVRSVDKRKREFRATRRLFREGLARLGEPAVPLLNDEKRAPRWPSGLRGSVTHAEGWCAVALGRSRQWSGIGIDVELAEPMSAALSDRILTSQEQARLAQMAEHERARLAKLFFSAKESVYKCQYERSRQFVGFQEVSLLFDHRACTFSVQFHVDVEGWQTRQRAIYGRYKWSSRWVATTATCRADG